VDPDPYPAFQVNTDPVPVVRIQGFDDQKLEKNTAEKCIFFDQKLQFISLGLLKGRPSYR
jgi:hypothetical protein